MRYNSGLFNDLGDELIVLEGVSDWGEEGFFVAEAFFREATQREVITPKVFYKSEESAILDVANVAKSYGFAKRVSQV